MRRVLNWAVNLSAVPLKKRKGARKWLQRMKILRQNCNENGNPIKY